MSRRLLHNSIAILAVLWLLAFSVMTPHNMVICAGHGGHIAVEPVHPGHDEVYTPTHSPIFSESECGDCSDTPIFSYFGITRLASITHVISPHPSVAFLGDIPGITVNARHIHRGAMTLSPLIDASLFGSVILLC